MSVLVRDEEARIGAEDRGRPRTLPLAAIAATIYLGIAVVLTWPLVLRPDEVLFGEVIDLQGGIAFLDARLDAGESPFAPGRLTAFNLAGGGAEIPWQTHLATAPSTALLTLLGLAFGATASYGLFALLGYVASGLAMMLLLLRLGSSRAVAVLLGAVFAFWPFATLSGGIPEFIHQWVLVLVAWRAVELVLAPTRRSGLLLGLAFGFAAFWTPYFLLLGGVLFATLAAVALAVAARQGRAREALIALAVACVVVLPLLVALYALSISGSGASQVPDRNQFDLYAYSARPTDFLLPPAENPILGERIAGWVFEHRRFEGGGGPYPLYLGVVVMLALVGAAAALVRRRVPWTDLRATLFVPVLIAGLLFSGPPKVSLGGLVLPLPPLVVYEWVTPAWRIYSRFGILVMLGAVVVASIALSRALSRWRGWHYWAAVAAVAAVATADFLVTPGASAVRPGGSTLELEPPELYQRLRSLPDGGVAEYPIKPAGLRAYTDLYFQRYHGHPVLGGYGGGSEGERRAMEAANVEDPATGDRLRAMGVRYVVVPKHAVFPDPGPPPQPQDPRYRRAFEDDYGVLYELR
jgi:hypothetical protein